jgi:hypothetical protein
MWLLFSYVRRLYSDRIALIATALFTTSLLWMMYADSIHQAPVMQCTGFLALWGLIRVIETRRRRHHAALIVGSFACFFTSYDYGVFLPTAVLATIYLKAGNPFARGNRQLVTLCGLGCLLGIVAKCLCMVAAVGWHEFVADLHFQFLQRATSAYDRKFTSAVPTMIRRITLVFTPLAWITAAVHILRAIRAPSLAAAIRGTAVWMLLPALVFLYVFAQLAASQMLASQVLLPFYAIGSALLLERLLDGGIWMRRLAVAWLVVAPLWSFYFMVTHRRSVLDRDDVAKTNAYLAANDHNDFVLSNLLSDGHIQASFHRRTWPALDDIDAASAPREMMRIFELTGADYVHEVIFTGPDSRFIDKSLWPLAMPRRLWAITGSPHIHRDKTNGVIAEYDQRVLENLEAARAKKVLQLTNYAVYRVDRATVLAILSDDVGLAKHIDFGSVVALRHEILGWNGPIVLDDGTPASTILGIGRCLVGHCSTVMTKFGLRVKDERMIRVGQVMIRIESMCDLRLTFSFVRRSYMRFSINGFKAGPMFGDTVTFTVPAAHLAMGGNVVEIENVLPPIFGSPLAVSSVDLAPTCADR